MPAALLPSRIAHEGARPVVLDMRLDQEYLRSQPVNSEEGAPMGIGVWYEMFISDPEAFLFKKGGEEDVDTTKQGTIAW